MDESAYAFMRIILIVLTIVGWFPWAFFVGIEMKQVCEDPAGYWLDPWNYFDIT